MAREGGHPPDPPCLGERMNKRLGAVLGGEIGVY